jgi:hypothetical protein
MWWLLLIPGSIFAALAGLTWWVLTGIRALETNDTGDLDADRD